MVLSHLKCAVLTPRVAAAEGWVPVCFRGKRVNSSVHVWRLRVVVERLVPMGQWVELLEPVPHLTEQA